MRASLPAYRVISSAQNGFSLFLIDGIWGFSMLALPLVSAALCIALHWDDMQKVKEMVFSGCYRIRRNASARGYASAAWDGTKCY